MKRVFCFALLFARLAWCWSPESSADYYKQFEGCYKLVEEEHSFHVEFMNGVLIARVVDVGMDFELTPSDHGKFDVSGYPNCQIEFSWTEDGTIKEVIIAAPFFNGAAYHAFPCAKDN